MKKASQTNWLANINPNSQTAVCQVSLQGNFANIGKYIFYILNAIGALFVWNDEEVEQ